MLEFELQFIWWRFTRHRIAMVALIFLVPAYLTVFFTEIVAPYGLETRNTQHIYMPPQPIHLFHEGRFVGPFVYAMNGTLDMDTLQRRYVQDRSAPMPRRVFCQGEPYRFWSLVPGCRSLGPRRRASALLTARAIA